MAKIDFVPVTGDKLSNIGLLHELCDMMLQNPKFLDDVFHVLATVYSVEELYNDDGWLTRRVLEGDDRDPTFLDNLYRLANLLAKVLNGVDNGKIKADVTQLKGKLLELYLKRLLVKTYDCEGCRVENRCFVRINNWQSARETDVLAWDGEHTYGEFYECKFRINYSDMGELQGHLNNLRSIRQKVQDHFQTVAVVGFATFLDSLTAEQAVTLILGSNPGDSNFCILGREQLRLGTFAQPPARRC